MNISYPYGMDARGRTAEADEVKHVRDMLEQLLFTMPGERVNRPDFGCGLMQLVFAPNSEELAAATQYLTQGALQQWLGDLIVIHDVRVESEDAVLRVAVDYALIKTGRRVTENFEMSV